MKNQRTVPVRKFHVDFVRFSLFLALILMIASWLFVFQVDHANFFRLFSHKNIHNAKSFLSGMLGLHTAKPAFTDAKSWEQALHLTLQTLEMSVMAIGFAAIGMLLTVIPAARTTAEGTVSSGGTWYRWLAFGIIRGIYVFSRAIPELLWAMMIIFVFNPGLLPGAIALALHNFGILGKLCAEVIEDLDMRPMRALSSSGAGKVQILFYGIIPTVLPRFFTYILYRWEVIIRTTIVVGFVGAGGLGLQFKLSMSFFHYTEVFLLLICYVILVFIADLISEGLRRSVQ